MLIKHRQQMYDLEVEQENRVVMALCDLWRVRAAVLHCGFGAYLCVQCESIVNCYVVFFTA